MSINKSSFIERVKYMMKNPSALGKGLWGGGKMPMHWKLLFAGQSLIFTLAIWVRLQDIERAKRLKKMEDDEKAMDGSVVPKRGGDGEVASSVHR